MKRIFTLVLLSITINCVAQDSLLTYQRVLKLDSLTKENIYDKSVVWLGERFTNSNYAIKVSDKQSGAISGKARIDIIYKYPAKKDSALGVLFNNFCFNWLTEIKDNKMRITITEIEYECKTLVKLNDSPDVTVLFQRKSKTQEEWNCAKMYLIKNFDYLFDDLAARVMRKDKDW